ncbi:carbohydrate ABC transporter permease [Fervidobacterium pennivorans]|uniref:carbohydrate ABC transporter permease n=1 Tax=Fervidobacterium pennivorans TaxID=93466 RepID=UPI00201B7C5A|nr:sugar ABC transporter permease [Fervidobacterium pennivorans]
MIYSIYMSTFDWNLFHTAERKFIGFGNFIRLFKDKEFLHSLWLQFGFVVIALPIETIIGFFVALLLNRDGKFYTLVRSLLLLPVFILPVISGLTWRLMLQPEYGIISFILEKLGFGVKAWLAEPDFAYGMVVVQDVWRMWPFMFMFIYAGLTGLPREIIEAAEIDGARFWTRVFKIILPQLRSTIATAFLLRLVDALRIFSEVYVMTGGGPGNATMLLSLYINKQAFEFFNIGYAAAMGVVLLVLALTISFFIVRRNIQFEGERG